MSEFDRSEVEPRLEADLGDLRKSLHHELLPADVSRTSKSAFKLRVLRELLLHRLSDLGEAAFALYKQNLVVPAIVLTRAAFETMAALYYLLKNVEAAVETGQTSDLDSIAMKGLLGAKDKSTEIEAVNILTAIDHLNKRVDGARDMFAELCEFAHPNCAGVLVAYQKLGEGLLADPSNPILIGREAAAIDPGYGLVCLEVAVVGGVQFAGQLASHERTVTGLLEKSK